MPSQVKAASGVTHVGEEELITYPPGDFLQPHAHIPDFNVYQALYDKSIHHPQEFWTEVASDFYWKSPPDGKVLDYNFDLTKGNIFVEFMKGAKTNVCYNVLDRNVFEKNLGAKTAYFWYEACPYCKICKAGHRRFKSRPVQQGMLLITTGNVLVGDLGN